MNNANYQPQRKCELSALIEIQQALGLFFLILLFATLFTGGCYGLFWLLLVGCVVCLLGACFWFGLGFGFLMHSVICK